MQCDSAEEFILSIVILSPEVEGNFHIIPHLMYVFFLSESPAQSMDKAQDPVVSFVNVKARTTFVCFLFLSRVPSVLKV